MTREKSAKEFRQGLGRARTLMRQAFGHWPGVPLREPTQLVWRSWSETEGCPAIVVDGRQLREMELTLKCLSQQHEPHLDKLLPDAQNWLERASNCLELLKEFLYKPPAEPLSISASIEQLALPNRWQQQSLDLVRHHPELEPLLWYLSFLQLTSREPDEAFSLAWIEQHTQELVRALQQNVTLPLLIQLVRLGPQIHPGWLETIFGCLGDAALSGTPVVASFTYADDLGCALREQLGGKASATSVPPKARTFAEEIKLHLRQLGSLKPGAVRTITRLLGNVAGQDLLKLVSVLNEQAQREQRRLQRELKRVRLLGVQYYLEIVGESSARKQSFVQTNLRDESDCLVMLWKLAVDVCDPALDTDCLLPFAEFFELARPLRAADRIHVAAVWQCEFEQGGGYLRPLNELIRQRGWHAKLRRYWSRRLIPRGTSGANPLDLILSGCQLADKAGWKRTLQLLERLVYDSNQRLTNDSINAIVPLSQVNCSLDSLLWLWEKLDLQLIADAGVDALREGYWVTQDIQELRMLLVWFKSHVGMAKRLKHIRASLTDTEPIGRETTELLKRLVRQRDTQALLRWSESLTLWQSFNQAYPKAESPVEAAEQDAPDSTWVSQYPAAFREILTRLNCLGPRGQSIAQRVLKERCPSARDLQYEIAELNRRLSDRTWRQQQTCERLNRMSRRLSNLEQRLAEPTGLSVAQEQRLIDKLHQRVDRELLDAIVARSHLQLESRLEILKIDELRERLRQPPYNGILPALVNLSRDQQQLAWRALGNGWGNTLRLLQEPANQSFIKRMQARGLNLDAWFESAMELWGKRADGTAYRVAFTQDPLDILLMGHHFATCLALDGCNFYSTVSNLVDANKRVLYGKTPKGQIVGRCLFALTNQGKLQTFARYQHCNEDGFEELVNQFAEQLAQAIGTVQTDSGHVPCLVSQSWYNDGCVALPDSLKIKAIEFGGALREHPDCNAYELALSKFGSEPELIRAAELMFDEGVFWRLPHLESLFPHLVGSSQVSVAFRLRLASRLAALGAGEMGKTVFEYIGRREFLRAIGRPALQDLMYDIDFVDFVVDYDPRLARRLLRKSRPRSVRSDEQEVQQVRVHARDKILERLKGVGLR